MVIFEYHYPKSGTFQKLMDKIRETDEGKDEGLQLSYENHEVPLYQTISSKMPLVTRNFELVPRLAGLFFVLSGKSFAFWHRCLAALVVTLFFEATPGSTSKAPPGGVPWLSASLELLI